MKYLIVEIMERNGDMEYQDKFILGYEGDQDEALEEVWIEWRGCSYEEYKNGEIGLDFENDRTAYWSDTSLVYYPEVKAEIPDDEIEILRKYFSVL